MNRDVAVRLDGMIVNINSGLNATAFYIESRRSGESAAMYNRIIGECMATLLDLHDKLVHMCPDIEMDELKQNRT